MRDLRKGHHPRHLDPGLLKQRGAEPNHKVFRNVQRREQRNGRSSGSSQPELMEARVGWDVGEDAWLVSHAVVCLG